MNIGRAKEYFQLGLLDSALIRAPSVLHEGWTIEFSGRLANVSPSLETTLGRVRQFSAIATAAKAVRDVGFKQFCVITD